LRSRVLNRRDRASSMNNRRISHLRGTPPPIPAISARIP